MAVPDEIAEMESQLRQRGLTPTHLCRSAGIAYTNWGRWKSGANEPTLRSWRAVQEAFDRLSENAAA